MTAHTETEVKLYCPNLSAIARKLIQAGAALAVPRVFERNVRYENADESLTASGIVVRLRHDYRTRLTYKGPGAAQDGIIARYEAEVEVSDFDTMHAILLHLGYHPHLIYEKFRTTYTLDDVEIVLDELPYGYFVEIEGSASAIEQTLHKLDIGSLPRYGQSYTALFEIVKQNLKLDFQHLTFENFDGITVPETAFKVS
jgi:adenylate cyclase class 2